MSEYLDYEGLLRYNELIDAKKADNNNVVKLTELSLTSELKAQVRTNIGAFSGSYDDLTSKPALDGTYNATTNKIATLSTVTTAILGLDGNLNSTTPGAGKTLTAFSQTDGVVSVTFENISITKSQVSDFPSSMPASDVSDWAKASSKPSYTASEVGLGNVGNFKAVSTVANQELTDTEKSNARANIGAGTSSFSGSYDDLSNKPTIPSLSGYATETWVNGKINDLVGIDADGVSTLAAVLSDNDTTTGLLTQISGKVDKVSGKGLSTNDFTTDLKNKLDGIASGATAVSETTVSNWGFTKNAGTVIGVKVGSSGTTINPSSGVITIPAYETGAQVHIAPTSTEVKTALGTGSGTTKFLREDGTWQTPDYTTNTDKTGVKLGTVSGTKKTDSTVIKADSSTGLVLEGGTNLFKIGDGTNYIEVPITPSVSGYLATVAKLGSTTKPVYTSAAGTFAECSTYAGGTAVTLNGTSKAASTTSFYAPTAAGTSGQFLTSSGGAPSWTTHSAITHSAVGSATLDSTKQIDALFIS